MSVGLTVGLWTVRPRIPGAHEGLIEDLGGRRRMDGNSDPGANGESDALEIPCS